MRVERVFHCHFVFVVDTERMTVFVLCYTPQTIYPTNRLGSDAIDCYILLALFLLLEHEQHTEGDSKSSKDVDCRHRNRNATEDARGASLLVTRH